MVDPAGQKIAGEFFHDADRNPGGAAYDIVPVDHPYAARHRNDELAIAFNWSGNQRWPENRKQREGDRRANWPVAAIDFDKVVHKLEREETDTERRQRRQEALNGLGARRREIREYEINRVLKEKVRVLVEYQRAYANRDPDET